MTLLAERQRTYGIPEAPYLAAAKNVLIFRLPNETRTAGGLYIADSVQEPKPMGVLIGAGLAALDIMTDHLIEIGDIVWFGRFAGWEREIQRDPEGKGKQILQMKIEDVLGSVDALDRVKRYDIDLNEDGEHIYVAANDNAVAKRRAAK
jgi:co-chaperonin GroES (HSP10)